MPPKQKSRRHAFEYSPLRSRYFRLLQDYDLDSAPPYEALSYTWGDEKPTCRISINSLPFYIRLNLGDALRRLRQPRGIRVIWIDAICINQSSTEEKNIQVPLMDHIYSRAKRVVVWLGEEDFDTGKAIDFIPHLTDIAKIDETWLWRTLLKIDEFLRSMSSLIRFFYRPWWTRVWVIQEVALAPDVLVICGSRHIPWSIFHAFVVAWMDTGHEPHFRELGHLQKAALRNLGMLVSGYSEALVRLRQELQTMTSAPKLLQLPDLLWSFKYRSVTDPKDRIYGLLGLLRNHGVQVDYGKSTKDVYQSFFSSCLLEDRGLDWFRWMTGERYRPNDFRLPSWVPDFGPRAMRPVSSFLPDSNQGERQRVYSTAGLDRSRSLCTIQFEDDHRTLVLRGCFFDVVSQCGGKFPLPDDIYLAGCSPEKIISHWKKMALDIGFGLYPSQYARDNAFWRTILTDRQIEGFHFKENAGWKPAQRLPPEIKCVPPKNAQEEQELLQVADSRSHVNGRRFCITKKGHFCLLPPTVRVGDVVCVLLGGEVPYVLRRIDNQGRGFYTMVGECYVHGIMDGEAIVTYLQGKETWDVFRLQ